MTLIQPWLVYPVVYGIQALKDMVHSGSVTDVLFPWVCLAL